MGDVPEIVAEFPLEGQASSALEMAFLARDFLFRCFAEGVMIHDPGCVMCVCVFFLCFLRFVFPRKQAVSGTMMSYEEKGEDSSDYSFFG